MKLTTVQSALILLLFSGNLFSFSTKAYNTYSSNLELHETSDIEKGSYLNYEINLFIEINSHKVGIVSKQQKIFILQRKNEDFFVDTISLSSIQNLCQ